MDAVELIDREMGHAYENCIEQLSRIGIRVRLRVSRPTTATGLSAITIGWLTRPRRT